MNSKQIKKLILEKKLIKNYLNLDLQLQPCGFDLTLNTIYSFLDKGKVDFSNQNRIMANTKKIKFDNDGWYNLRPGCYQITYNETVDIPLNIVALARPRSTLLRNGAIIGTAVWDPGYNGRSVSLLIVNNPFGIDIQKNARITQIIFFKIIRTDKSYKGIFQFEGL